MEEESGRSREQNVYIQYYYQQIYSKIPASDKKAFTLLDEIERASSNTDLFLEKIYDKMNPSYYQELEFKPMVASRKDSLNFEFDALQHMQPPLIGKNTSQGQAQKGKIQIPTPRKQNILTQLLPQEEAEQKEQPENRMAPPQSHENVSIPMCSAQPLDILDNNLLSQIGINEKDEEYTQYANILIQNQRQSDSNFVHQSHHGHPRLSSREDQLLNPKGLKHVLEYRLQRDKQVKEYDPSCLETIEFAFQFFLRGNLHKLYKIAFIENEQDNLHSNLFRNNELYSQVASKFNFYKNEKKRSLIRIRRSEEPERTEPTQCVKQVPLENPLNINKKIDKVDRQEQIYIEEAIKNKTYFDNIFNNNNMQVNKKVKKYIEDELYKLFLKQNQDTNNDQIEMNKRTAEDAKKAIEIFRNFGTAKKVDNNVPENYQQNQQESQKKSRKNKNRISLRAVILFLETYFKKSKILVKAYNQANI